MSQGFFGSDGQLWFEIQLVAASGEALFVSALFDTGFTDGWLTINRQDLDAFEWPFIYGQVEMRTARGDVEFDLHEGTVIIDGTEFTVPVYVGDDIPETAMGSAWLNIMELVVNKPKGILQLNIILEE
jgi:predicted aspartyl protease